MSVTVVVGGQFGSEGKGKTASLLARDYGEGCAVVRCGGPNSGHIVVDQGREHRFRLLPAGLVYGRRAFLAPAAVVDLEVLRHEIHANSVPPSLLSVDPYSVVVTDEMKAHEQGLVARISSTGSGTGAATAAKCLRGERTLLVKDVLAEHVWLAPYVRDVRSEVHRFLDRGGRLVVEGTQGFGLSLHHSRMFPQTTSKDTTAAQFVMEAGLSPLQVSEVILVVRTYPIRVAGRQAGPMPNEISWNDLRSDSGAPGELREFTTVTNRLRRVARFDMQLVGDACVANRPTGLVVHGLDYLGWENHGVVVFEQLNTKARAFLQRLRSTLEVPILYAFTGRDNSAVVRNVEPGLNRLAQGTDVPVLEAVSG